jgi:hypothetical protein
MAALALPAAAARANFTVYPSLVDLQARPGHVASGTISVRLAGERRRAFRVDVEDVIQDPDGSYRYAPPSRSPYSASTWIALRPARFAGGPSRTQPVEYVVRVPRGAEPGDHVTSLTVKRLPGRGQAGVTEAVSVRLTIRVPGAVRHSADVSSFSAPLVTGGGSITSHVDVVNTGNVRIDFDRGDHGSLAILGGGAAKARTTFAGTVFPGERRRFKVVWDDPPLVGHFDARALLTLGRGHATAATRGIWVVPWRQAAALLLLLGAVAVARGRPRRRAVAR